jgi:hypothetical protein
MPPTVIGPGWLSRPAEERIAAVEALHQQALKPGDAEPSPKDLADLDSLDDAST